MNFKAFQIVTLLIVALLAMPIYADGLTCWLGGDTDVAGTDASRSLAARVGYRFTLGNLEPEQLEAGLSVLWLPSDELKVPQTWTAYGLCKIGGVVAVPNPLKLLFMDAAWMPAEVLAQPAAGWQIGFDVRNNGVISGPIANLSFWEIMSLEYQYRNYAERLGTELANEHKLMLFLRFAIP